MRDREARDSDKPREERVERTLKDISATVWLTEENAIFFMKNGFLYIRYQEKEERAFLARQFPFELQWEFISVLDAEQQEIGMIRDLSVFGETAKELLTVELARRYYTPVIRSILQVKERYGFSNWKVTTDEGEMSFTLHDTYRSMIRAGGGRLILLDVNGNRFEIPNAEDLDRKSYKKIELYL